MHILILHGSLDYKSKILHTHLANLNLKQTAGCKISADSKSQSASFTEKEGREVAKVRSNFSKML